MAYLHKNHGLIDLYHETYYTFIGRRLPDAERTRSFRADGDMQYADLKDLAVRTNGKALASVIDKAYLQGKWELIK